ncbi:MAG: Kae1-associated kinase Bud32 [Methanosarcinaceae archaeon]|jgi:Kae1-associated kinase Bud32|nr:Kae1-associated kinase Bud32 [Methanosarcinaceae archaeon]NKQ39147.1 Kae1-associated kinase Bud32 [Methanosarcinales archaeon]
MENKFLKVGAEATVELKNNLIIKKRVPKHYRVKELDERIRRMRTKREARLISESRRKGIPTPIIKNLLEFTIEMEYIEGDVIKEVIDAKLSEKIGELIGKLHNSGIVHGDLTTSNMILHKNKIYLIDFGLGSFDETIESKGVDICVLFRTFKSTHNYYGTYINAFCKGYKKTFNNAEEVLKKVDEIKKRGRYM